MQQLEISQASPEAGPLPKSRVEGQAGKAVLGLLEEWQASNFVPSIRQALGGPTWICLDKVRSHSIRLHWEPFKANDLSNWETLQFVFLSVFL